MPSVCVSLALMTFSETGGGVRVDLLLALFRSTSSWSPLSIEMGETEAASGRPPPPSRMDDVLEFSSVLDWCW